MARRKRTDEEKAKNPFAHLGLDWQTMKIGSVSYDGTAKGAKANVCRANRSYKPKKWRSYQTEAGVFIERVA